MHRCAISQQTGNSSENRPIRVPGTNNVFDAARSSVYLWVSLVQLYAGNSSCARQDGEAHGYNRRQGYLARGAHGNGKVFHDTGP